MLRRSPSASSPDPSRPQAQTGAAQALRDFEMVSPTEGWILVGQQLYWTSDNAGRWDLITPDLPAGATVYTTSFLDAQTGWVLWGNQATDGSLVLQIESTSDRGGDWKRAIIQTFTPGDPEAAVENASMDWLDASTGWVSLKQQTGSNFSAGVAFHTKDGGQTWQRQDLPVGEPPQFVDSQVGWLAGGPAGDQIFKTQDGGDTWVEQAPPVDLQSSQSFSLYPPIFESPGKGRLAAVRLAGDDFSLEIFSTGDGGRSWLPGPSFGLGSLAGRLPLSRLDGGNLVAVVPTSDRIIHMVDGEVSLVKNQDGMSSGIVDLKMLTPDTGWAKWNQADCTKQSAADSAKVAACSSTTRLVGTRDGGITWEALELPGNLPGSLAPAYRSSTTGLVQSQAPNVGKTLISIGQGFDICEIPTLANLQTWWNYSPYTSVNLYIGGVARGCPNSALNAAYISQMRAQGWTFIPTWVGPQAPCTNFTHKFSYDVNQAFIQGKDEAYYATARLAEFGLTEADMTDSVVYYDLEGYDGTNTACREAAKAFINGWVSHLHDFTNLAGVYGGTLCDSGLTNYLSIPNVPDVVWPARWYLPAGQGTYDPNASVWDLGTCFPTTVWNSHQRIRQYAGDHFETWGGSRSPYSIDSDVLDGVVALPYFGVPSPDFTAVQLTPPPMTAQFTIANTAFLSSCDWDYGDGSNSTSCGYIHTHVYAIPGTYTVSLTVSSAWGAENLSSSQSITILPNTTTAITSDLPDPSVTGQAITINYSVVPIPPAVGTPTGNVTVSDGTESCTGTVAAGHCSIAFGIAGAKSLVATYAGDASFTGSLSSPGTAHTVNKASTTTAITSDLPDPSVVGQPVPVNYSVAAVSPGSGTPTGNVTVSDGTYSCTGTIAAGTCSITFGTHGARTLTATYAGDANYYGSASTPGTAHQVNPASTTTAITSDLPDPSVVGQPVTVNYSVAAVAPGSGTPTGNVTVSDSVQSCTGTIAAGHCSIAFTTAGAKALTATFSGDGNYAGSVSSPVAAHSVNPADTITTINSDLPDPSVVGQTVTIHFSVAAASPGSGTPTGNVTVTDGIQSCIGTAAGGSCSITFATPGVRTLAAWFTTGNANFNSSVSAGESHNVRIATTTAITNPDDLAVDSMAGEAYLVTYSVTALTGGSPTGNVTVSDGFNSCVGTVSYGMCTLTSSRGGVRWLTATYAGDDNFSGSTSDAVAHMVHAYLSHLPLIIR
jgi:PKD repeat protein